MNERGRGGREQRGAVAGSRGWTRRQLMARSAVLGAGAGIGLALGGLPAARSAAAQEAAPAELTVWLGGEPGTVNAYTKIFDAYMAEHPNVAITATFIGSDLFNPSLLPALNAGEGPDIWQGGTGPGQPAALIAAGHALDLTPYYCSLGWADTIPETIVGVTSSDGKLWAVGDSVETTVMFYNKEIFAQNDLAIPATWADLMAACETLKAAGFAMPIGLGGADKWPITQWQTMLWGRYAGPEGLDRVMFGDGRWDEDPFVQATAKITELRDAGCFGPDPVAVFQDDMIGQFWRGEVPMVFTGPWVIGPAVADLGDGISKFSVFQVPPPVDGTPIYPTENIGQGWYINAQYEQPDVAADVIDFMLFNPDSRKELLQSGDSVPVGPLDLAGVELPTITEDIFAVTNEFRGNGTIHAFFDTVTPANVNEIAYDGTQALLAGQMSPEEFAAAFQAAWEEAKAENLQLQPGGVECG